MTAAAKTPFRQSARAILIKDEQVALIERRRNGRRFFVFPGGSVEAGETSAQAAIREVDEELGIIIRPTRIVAEVTFPDRVQSFWLAEMVGGEFGTGTGAEMTGQMTERNGSYHPVWLPLSEILRLPVLPRCVAAELQHRRVSGWPDEVLRFSDAVMWWNSR